MRKGEGQMKETKKKKEKRTKRAEVARRLKEKESSHEISAGVARWLVVVCTLSLLAPPAWVIRMFPARATKKKKRCSACKAEPHDLY